MRLVSLLTYGLKIIGCFPPNGRRVIDRSGERLFLFFKFRSDSFECRLFMVVSGVFLVIYYLEFFSG